MQELKPVDVNPEIYQHTATCYCGSTLVTSRMPRWYDKYVVCSFGCFEKMSSETDYFSKMFGGENGR